MTSLIKKAQSGDKEAFIELIELHTQSMYKVARGILKNDTDAADAMQDTTLNCYEKLCTLQKPKYFKTWLIRILINNCNRILRENLNMISIDEHPELYKAEEISSNVEVLHLLNQLENQYRTIMLLFYIEEFSIKEISTILELNENTIKTRLSRGRISFKRIYLKEHPSITY